MAKHDGYFENSADVRRLMITRRPASFRHWSFPTKWDQRPGTMPAALIPHTGKYTLKLPYMSTPPSTCWKRWLPALRSPS